MGIAAQIRNHRVRAGKSAGEVASHLGINEAWYQDLEHHDDELASTLTLFQAQELAAMLGVSLRDLFEGEALVGESIPLFSLPSYIEARISSEGITIAQFEDEVGWELSDFLRSPLKVAAESPLMFLQAVAQRLDIPWLSLVPDGNAV